MKADVYIDVYLRNELYINGHIDYINFIGGENAGGPKEPLWYLTNEARKHASSIKNKIICVWGHIISFLLLNEQLEHFPIG